MMRVKIHIVLSILVLTSIPLTFLKLHASPCLLYFCNSKPPPEYLNIKPHGHVTLQQALREDSVLKLKLKTPSLESPPPPNMTVAERKFWFRHNLHHFKFLRTDVQSLRFQSRVNSFFSTNCRQKVFMTWISPAKMFTYKEVLCLESLFKWNPKVCLVILSRSLDSSKGRNILTPLVRRGYNVTAVTPDVEYLVRETPAEKWMNSVLKGDVDPGEFPFAQNLSNLLRLAVLYRYGGVYLDTDFIILRDISGLRNTVGAQSEDRVSGNWTRINNAMLAFDKGHPVIMKFIEEFVRTFDGSKWGHNGPYLVSRVLSRSPSGVRVLGTKGFYPVDWSQIWRLFKRHDDRKWRMETVKAVEKESYGVHLWNKHSRGFGVEKGSIVYMLFKRNSVSCDFSGVEISHKRNPTQVSFVV